jgi:Homeodomain-like domain
MHLHANAKLGLAGRLGFVKVIEDGMSLKAAAAAFSVSPATAHRWWHRWLDAGEEARRTLSCLFDRSSRPRRSPTGSDNAADRGDVKGPHRRRRPASRRLPVRSRSRTR